MLRPVSCLVAALACVCVFIPSHAAADRPPSTVSVVRADPYAYAPPAPDQLYYNWSGFYIGGDLGFANMSGEDTLTTGASEGTSESANSVIGGVHAGYQKQFRAIVLGAEVSYSWTGAEFTAASVNTPGLFIKTAMSDLLMVNGRLGYAYMNWLAYFKAGYASADIDYTARGTGSGSASSRGQGWMAGVGLNHAVTPNIILGAEYNYIHISADNAALPAAGATLSGASLDVQAVMFRIDFKFAH